MKKLKFGSMEILGYIGILIWVAVILLRGVRLSDNAVYLFLRGSLPNLGAAWAVTLFGKWIILFVFKQAYTMKKHIIFCLGLAVLALASEVIHDVFFGSPFDFYDILVMIVAQLIIFFLPIVTRDKYFKGYE